MPAQRSSMRKLRDILRLKLQADLSIRQINRSLRISVGLVSKTIKKAQALNLDWPSVEALDKRSLAELFYPKADVALSSQREMPDWFAVRKELTKPSMTKYLAWEEYAEQYPTRSYGYAQYCHHFLVWSKKQRRSMRQIHIAGEKLFVDYAGQTVAIVNSLSGEVRTAQIFVAVMGASNYTYAEATYTQTLSEDVTFAACWAHARRKFIEVSESGPSPIADKAIAFIQSLYAIEKSIQGKLPDDRQQIRTQQALPILDKFYDWLQMTLRTLSKGSAISKAIHYTLKQWEGLNAYVHDGHAASDNNTAERSLRPIALGCKNYLFAGSPAGGERAAVLYSIISTANLNGINPRKYLTAVLKRIGQHPINKIDELLPWNIDLAMTSETDAP